MRSVRVGVLAACFAVMLAGCSSGSYMGLREQCRFKDCYNIQKGVTPEEFFAAKIKKVPPPDKTYRLDGDVWDIYVFSVSANVAGTPPPDDAVGAGYGSDVTVTHSEYVAFKNGRLETWGWGKMPRYLKRNRDRLALGNS